MPRFASQVAVNSSTLVPVASGWDTLMTAADVLIPTIAKGPIVRRPRMLAIAEWLDLDRRAIRRMQRLAARYGKGPLLLRIPGRTVAMILDGDHVHRILGDTPEPFTPASYEKVAALSHFEPKGVLVSKGSERKERRRFNDQALESHRPVHHLGESFVGVVRRELGQLSTREPLTWQRFSEAWFRIVRQVIFGAGARDDDTLSDLMYRLRQDANWAFLRPQHGDRRQRLHDRIRMYLQRAEENSLAAAMAHIPVTPQTAPEQQVPQWLFAFDAAAMATYRGLGLLAAHRDVAARRDVPFLRATVLESLRLWPTTPLLLRETTLPTTWENGVLPENTAIVIFTPFFHRDNNRLSFADSFAPEIWMEGREAQKWPLVPFSEGSAACPGRELVLMLASAALSALQSKGSVYLKFPAAAARRPSATRNAQPLRVAIWISGIAVSGPKIAAIGTCEMNRRRQVRR